MTAGIAAGMAPDLARAAEVVAARGERIGRLGRPLAVMAETESTNDDAKRGARDGAEHGATWVADVQTRGRGRQGRAWISPRGENLLFSIVLRLACPPARVPPLALVCGLAVRDAAERALGSSARVFSKWPNDVLVRGRGGRLRKLAGVLVESQIAGGRVDSVVVGVGLNVHTRDFPDELREVATSLALEGARPEALDRAELLCEVLARIDHDVEHAAHKGLGGVHARLVAHDALAGQRIVVDDVRGTACGIDTDGRLLVRRDDGVVVRVASGEVVLHTERGDRSSGASS